MSNERLRAAFKKLHNILVNSVNASSVVDHLFAADVITEDDNLDIDHITDRRSKCRRLLAIIHASDHPDSFVQFRVALERESAYKWLVDEIDKLQCQCHQEKERIPNNNFDEVDSGCISRSAVTSSVSFTSRCRESPMSEVAAFRGSRTDLDRADCDDKQMRSIKTIAMSKNFGGTMQLHETDVKDVVEPVLVADGIDKMTLVEEYSELAADISAKKLKAVRMIETTKRDSSLNTENKVSPNLLEVESTNELLRKIFLRMEERIIHAVDATSLTNRMGLDGVINAESVRALTSNVFADPSQQCRQLLAVLQTSERSNAFVKLRAALSDEVAYKWIVDDVDMICASVCPDVVRPPFCRHSQLMRRHQANLSNDVYGIAQLDDRLYVVCHLSDLVRVFSTVPPYGFFGAFQVGVRGASLNDPCDLVTSAKPHRLLYIGDKTGVWVMSVGGTGDLQFNRWIRTACRPWSLSIRSGRLLVTPWNDVIEDVTVTSDDTSRIFVYDVDGKLSVSVRLPSYVVPRHSIETRSGTFLVAYVDRFTNLGQVIEIDTDRRVIRGFNLTRTDEIDRVTFRLIALDPSYLVLDAATGSVLVADSCRQRVVILDERLEPVGILVDRLYSQVYRMCRDDRGSHLFVGCFNSRSLFVFRLL